MKFTNKSAVPLDFVLDGVRYQVPVGGTCEIPDRVIYAVKSSGIPLTADEQPAAAAPRHATAAHSAPAVDDDADEEPDHEAPPEKPSTAPGPAKARR